MILRPSNADTDSSITSGEGRANSDLLHDFVRDRDEEAFAALVKRHGPMVFAVCRRLLGNEHDAADAFQAAFLVLARKAASIHTPEVLGTWLYNVAYRTSMKARSVRSKRAARERQVSVMPEPVIEDPVAMHDYLAEVVDEELRTLPAKHQAAIILCDLEGCNRKEAAAALNIAEGTLSSRLAHGRQKLAARLRRRGVVVSSTALGLALSQSTAGASIPAPLMLATVKAAVPTFAGQAATGLVSAKTLTIVDGVLNAMLVAKVKGVLLALAAFCVLASSMHVALELVNAESDEEAQALAALTRLGARLRWEATPTGKQLVMVDLKRTRVQDYHLKSLRFFKELRELWLNNTAVTDPGCAELTVLPKLRRLELNGTAVSNAGVKALATLSKLEVLALGWSKINDAALKDLAPLAELRELDLRQTSVSDAGLPDLASFAKLRGLQLGKTRVTDAGLHHLAALGTLRTVDLENTAVTDRGLSHLAACGQIEFLSLKDNPGVTDAGLHELRPLQRLGSLNLSGTRVTDAGVMQLAVFSQLRVLALNQTSVTGTGLVAQGQTSGALAQFLFGKAAQATPGFKLTALRLNRSKASDATLKNIAALNTLTELELGETAITDAGVKKLASLNRLDKLVLENTRVSDTMIADLAGCKRLWHLNLGGTNITDAALKQLASMPQLHQIEVYKTAVTDAGIKDLLALSDLNTLGLGWTKVSAAGLRDIASFKKLQTLRLGGLPVTDDSLKALVPLTDLRMLWLEWTKITDAGLKELAPFKLLEELCLDGTAVTEDGLKALAVLPQLQRLELQKTGLTPEAVTEVKAALPRVIINAPASAPTVVETDDRTRSFGWLLVLLGGLTTAALMAWLFIKRKSLGWAGVLTATTSCAVLAILILLGGRLAQGTAQTVQPANAPLPERILRGHTGPLRGLRFTPDGRRLVSASGWPGQDWSVRIWDLANERELFRIPMQGPVGAIVLSAGGQHALAGAPGNLVYLDVESGQVVKRMRHGGGGTTWVSFGADGRHVYSASHDAQVRRWDLESGQEVARFRVPGKWARYVQELPGGRLLTGDSAGVLQIWDIQSRQELKRIEAGPMWFVSAVTLSGDREVVIAGVQLSKWDLESGSRLQVFKGHKGTVTGMTLSPDGKTLLTAGDDGTARLWDLESGATLRVLLAQEEWLCAAAFSPDGRWVAVGGGGRKDGEKYLGGAQHDIHLLELPPAPNETTALTNSTGHLWIWLAASVAGLLLLTLAGLLAWRRGRRARAPKEAASEPEAQESPLVFFCSHCGARLRSRPQLAGKRIKCPKCATPTLVPPAAPTPVGHTNHENV